MKLNSFTGDCMYHKINKIIDDISNEIDVYETTKAEFYKEMFLKRLKYNIKDIKTLCVQEIQAEERMLNDLNKIHNKEN